jgi:putative transposase
VVSPQARREQVGFACEHGLSERRACGLLGIARSTLSYELTLPAKDAPVIAAMRACRRSTRATAIDGSASSCAARATSSAYTARTGYGARRAAAATDAGRAGASPPAVLGRCHRANANFVWAYDFVFDATAQGQQIKCLTVVDEFTHECLAIDVAGSIRSKRVIEVLSRLISTHGAPLFLRSDNGPEFVSRRDPRVDRRERHRHGADRSGQALAERNQRELQRPLPRRVPERRVVPLARRGQGRHRNLAPSLQRHPTAQQPELLDAARVQAAASPHPNRAAFRNDWPN